MGLLRIKADEFSYKEFDRLLKEQIAKERNAEMMMPEMKRNNNPKKLVTLPINRWSDEQKGPKYKEPRKQLWKAFRKIKNWHDIMHKAKQWGHEQFTEYEQKKI